jgi:hypothetical protein
MVMEVAKEAAKEADQTALAEISSASTAAIVPRRTWA